MSRLLLDTSAYSAAFRGNGAAKEAIQSAEELFLSPIVIGELLAGFAGGRHREKNEKELAEFLAVPSVSGLEIDQETARRYALILTSLRAAGTPIPTNDIWIAASAMQHGLELLTADDHFSKVGQIVVRPIRSFH